MSHSLKFIKNNELISKFLHDENHAKSKERHLTKILRKLSILMKKENINYREFDDLLFKLNINDISCFISDNFQNFRVKQLGYLCDFINDIPLSIHSIIIIYGITKNNLFFYEYIQQLPEIINLNLDAFQLPEIISVLKTYTNLINQVLENVINTIKNDQISIYALIKSFPDYFMRIILHINPTDIYPYLYLCPENTKKVFIAYFSLPVIIKDKIQLDKTSIISKFSLNSHCIIDIHNNILDLIGKNGVLTLIGIDFNLFSYSRTVKILKKHFSYFCNEFPQYLPEISDCLLESLTGIISNISISSLSSEREALQCFNILISLPLDTKTLKKIHILYDFISLLLYDHSSIIYDFKNYGSYQFAEKIAFLCFKLDYYSLGFDFCVEFNIPIHLYSNHIFHCCFSLGFRQEARQWATHSQIDERTLSMCFHKEAAFDTTPLIALVNTPVSYLANRDIAPFNFYHRMLVISKGIKSSVTNNELQSYITSHFQPLSRAIDLLVQYEFYDLAMTLITSIYDSKNLIDCFVNHLFLTAISFNHLNELLEFIFNIDPGMSFTLVLWNGMLSFFIQNEMTKSIIFFSEHINALETAAEYCLKLLFKEDVNNEEKIIYLCRCESNLMESLEIRNNKNYPNNRYPFRPSELTTENISKLLKKINVQKSIIQFYLTSKFVEEFGDCIFMFNAETAIHVSAQLLKFGEIILVYDLVEITEISRKQVVMELSKQLLQENASIDIIFHVLEIINQKYPFQFLDIFILFLQCFAEIKYVNLIHLFRLEAVDKKIACLLYIEYDYLEYAYSSAKENSFHDVLPLIANKSSKLGNKNLLCLCEKSLNNIHS
ncbi:hypothetical protein TRFO_36867 [Tritrichomonas foetus]|uniref:Uncharacterized protein n=1 Tax=Tritrichomonas foetus TaxID=1144522 RepID=A0A1J4JHP0_9EUKA|nr:hypothetical protein TRFO_36867 [Tritrichomonas foetus]|eukprot:OHS97005.1 hypothetical protein TRFO_36867 [Tritrichomonas foetus]